MIVVVGSLNMDLFIRVKRFLHPGESAIGEDFHTAFGGKGANQAYAIAKLGAPANLKTAMLGCVGEDNFGDQMVANLQSVGVDTKAILRRETVASGTAMITLDAQGQNQIVIAPGANATLSAADVSAQVQLFRGAQAVVVQLETTLPAVERALLMAREVGALTILNPAPYAPLSDDLLKLCDYVIPNESEATQLTGVGVLNVDSAAAAARMLRSRGARNVLVTLGDKGVWLESEGYRGHVPTYLVKALDTVGAGDTFLGGFVVGLLEGSDANSAAQFGCAAAAIAVTRSGAQDSVPTRAEATGKMKKSE